MNRTFIIQSVYFLLTSLLAISCAQSNRLEYALQLAGENRSELKEVLAHYSHNPADSLKLLAAEFLIENMPWHYTAQGEKLSSIQQRISSLFSQEDLSLEVYVERLEKIKQDSTLGEVSLLPDIENIDAKTLIDNIDAVFASCAGIRNGEMPFDIFCEYVLPYRIGLEPVEEWRSVYRERFGQSIDSLRQTGATDSLLARFLALSYKFAWFTPPESVPLPGRTMLNLSAGDCFWYGRLGAFVARSFGIPVSEDFVPQWGNATGRHEWNALLLRNDRQIAYGMADEDIANEGQPFGMALQIGEIYYGKRFAKVYRRTFSPNSEVLKVLSVGEEIPSFLQDPCFIDVTHKYAPTVDVEVKLTYGCPVKKRLVYAVVFDNQQWRPVTWGWIGRGRTASFSDLATNCVYMAMYYDGGAFHNASNPFKIDGKGVIHFLKPDGSYTQTVSLTRKYLDQEVKMRLGNTPGDRIQLATKSDFSDAEDMYVIDTPSEAKFYEIPVQINRKYRYMRYIASDYVGKIFNTPSMHTQGNVAELEIYNVCGEKISGSVIGTPEELSPARGGRSKAFDGDVLTFFEVSADSVATPWVGLRFDEPQQVGKIVYLPRNDDNFIRDGELYELFYWDGAWKSLGKKYGDRTQVLNYTDVPSNALLRLRNLTKGKQERIFVWENSKQEWW